MFDIQESLKNLPQKPGVYIMKNSADKIIYVGKAINLRNRVRQYFQPSSDDIPKVRSLRANIAEFEYIVCDSELEALILECNLIKKHRPKYNIRLKDDKGYPYIKVTVNEMFPRIFMTRSHVKDKAKYYGPYSSAMAVKETIELIHKLWPLRRCYRKFPNELGKGRPCLNYHIGQCNAPCQKIISEEAYDEMVQEAMQFLNGKQDFILKNMEKQMKEASEQLEFEKAAEYRDKIIAIEKLSEKQKVEMDSQDNRDIIAFARKGDEALVQVFFIRGGKMTGREQYMLQGVEGAEPSAVLTEFLKQFYGETALVPKEIVLETDINDREVIVNWLSDLRGSNVSLVVPQKGDKLRMVELARKNALLSLDQFEDKLKREYERTIGALAQLQEAMELDFTLDRIEAYDISNIQGFESVGSMVVFEKGRTRRSDYRKFKIKEVIGPDDYASIEEVIRRRFTHYLEDRELPDEGKFGSRPDILMIDGGKGQVNSACKALEAMGLADIQVCGMIKDDRHRTRGIIYQDREILLPVASEGFKLLTRIQDEVHRFAIEYHRKLRQKSQTHSRLDEIKGIGAARRKALIKHFGSVEDIKRAEVEDLCQVESMNTQAAQAVYDYFRGRG